MQTPCTPYSQQIRETREALKLGALLIRKFLDFFSKSVKGILEETSQERIIFSMQKVSKSFIDVVSLISDQINVGLIAHGDICGMNHYAMQYTKEQKYKVHSDTVEVSRLGKTSRYNASDGSCLQPVLGFAYVYTSVGPDDCDQSAVK